MHKVSLKSHQSREEVTRMILKIFSKYTIDIAQQYQWVFITFGGNSKGCLIMTI